MGIFRLPPRVALWIVIVGLMVAQSLEAWLR